MVLSCPSSMAAMGIIRGSSFSPKIWKRMWGRAARLRASPGAISGGAGRSPPMNPFALSHPVTTVTMVTSVATRWMTNARINSRKVDESTAAEGGRSAGPETVAVEQRQRATYPPSIPVATFHDAVRILAHRVPGVATVDSTAPTLERLEGVHEAPRVIDAQLVENATVARPVRGSPTPAFAAFLDGIQESRVILLSRGVPIVWGRVSAVIKRRIDRRLTTWGDPIIESRIYAPLSALDAETRHNLAGLPVIDTSRADDDPVLSRHPAHVAEQALHAVQRDRERAERTLAEQWCGTMHEPLLVDRSISGSDIVATHRCAVG